MLIVNTTVNAVAKMLETLNIKPGEAKLSSLFNQVEKDGWRHVYWSCVGVAKDWDYLAVHPFDGLRETTVERDRESIVFILSGPLDVWRDLTVKGLKEHPTFYEQVFKQINHAGYGQLFKDYSQREKDGHLVLRRK